MQYRINRIHIFVNTFVHIVFNTNSKKLTIIYNYFRM